MSKNILSAVQIERIAANLAASLSASERNHLRILLSSMAGKLALESSLECATIVDLMSPGFVERAEKIVNAAMKEVL